MRVLPLLFLLAGCGPAEVADDPPTGTRLSCALAGAAEFGPGCRVVRSAVGGRPLLTLIAPDGGFRRVEVQANGAGIAAADGAEPARVADGSGGEIEIAIGADRYRLPAASR